MKLSYCWLGEMVDLEGTTAPQVQDLLTFHTAEVEGRESFGADLEGVVTARVVAVRPHPNADKLRLCTVDSHPDGDPGPEGPAETVEVVCGAPNVAEGQVIAYAAVGVTLPGWGGSGGGVPGGGDGPITLERHRYTLYLLQCHCFTFASASAADSSIILIASCGHSLEQIPHPLQ